MRVLHAVLVGLLAQLGPAQRPEAERVDGQPSLQRVLTQWRLSFRTGRIDLQGLARERDKVHPVYGQGWLDKALPGRDLKHRDALRHLLRTAVDRGAPELLQEVLELQALSEHVAAQDREAVQRRREGGAVANLCRLSFGKLKRVEGVFYLTRLLRGDDQAWVGARPAQAEACRRLAGAVLARLGIKSLRPLVEARLRDEDRDWRLTAAEGIGERAAPASLRALAEALAREEDDIVAQALVQAATRVIARNPRQVDARDLRAVALSAIDAIGRCDWRLDLDLVQLLERLRTAAAVPALIAILERWTVAEGEARPEQVSGLLREAAFRTLRSLTGAVIAAHETDKWRAFWKQHGDSLVVPPPKHAKASSRTSAGFFGIPVQGSNVAFVIDLSGSMSAKYVPRGTFKPESSDGKASRLQVAKVELVKAVANLERGTRFNLVEFSDQARLWVKTLQRVDRGSKQRLEARVERLNAGGATNIYGALMEALSIKAPRRGSRYGVAVDEIFLLSDGAPSAGEIRDTAGILEAIRAENRYRKVRINALYMGGGNSSFMRRLAEQNGGRYVEL